MPQVAFSDLRGWLEFLEQRGQLARVTSSVHWSEELGAVVRRAYDVYGEASPAMLFENIVDYQPPRPNKLFVGQFRSYSRIAMSMGLPATGISVRDIVNRVRQCLKAPIPFSTVESGTAQENVVLAEEANIFDFPIPLWHHRDGGRYLGTMHVVITRDYDSDWVNVGLYRIMALEPNEATIYMSPGRQHIGQQYYKYV
ncbi:MAG TPA: UbiD family decarboxylase, partial [Chloroflexi bacterium]|nr:UbiD family decarboxylase [Chloroflexota bacterium]